jgi:hypothetical protein
VLATGKTSRYYDLDLDLDLEHFERSAMDTLR